MPRKETDLTGPEYEQFVRAVLCDRLNIAPDALISARSPGATLPGTSHLQHQIDLFYVEETEVAKYLTIIECKYRTSAPVDQQELQNLAFVKDNIRAHKAIMVTNRGFTGGAKAVAESQEIALLIVDPELQLTTSSEIGDVDELFRIIQTTLRDKPSGYKIRVERKFHGDPNDSAFDLIEGLLSDPVIRQQVEGLLRDPGIRDQAHRFVQQNPDLAKKAMDFLKKGRW